MGHTRELSTMTHLVIWMKGRPKKPVSVKCSWIHPSLVPKHYQPSMGLMGLCYAKKIKHIIGEKRWTIMKKEPNLIEMYVPATSQPYTETTPRKTIGRSTSAKAKTESEQAETQLKDQLKKQPKKNRNLKLSNPGGRNAKLKERQNRLRNPNPKNKVGGKNWQKNKNKRRQKRNKWKLKLQRLQLLLLRQNKER